MNFKVLSTFACQVVRAGRLLSMLGARLNSDKWDVMKGLSAFLTFWPDVDVASIVVMRVNNRSARPSKIVPRICWILTRNPVACRDC